MLQKYLPFFYRKWLLSSSSRFPLVSMSTLGRQRRWKSLRDLSVHGNNIFPSCTTSWCLNHLTWISEAERFSRSSHLTMSKSPDHPPPARVAFPMKIQGCIFFCQIDAALSRPSKILACGWLWLRTGLKVRRIVHNMFSHTMSCHRPFYHAPCACSNYTQSNSPAILWERHCALSLMPFLRRTALSAIPLVSKQWWVFASCAPVQHERRQWIQCSHGARSCSFANVSSQRASPRAECAWPALFGRESSAGSGGQKRQWGRRGQERSRSDRQGTAGEGTGWNMRREKVSWQRDDDMRTADTLEPCMCVTRMRMCQVFAQCMYTRKCACNRWVCVHLEANDAQVRMPEAPHSDCQRRERTASVDQAQPCRRPKQWDSTEEPHFEKGTICVDRTPHRTHIFLGLVSLRSALHLFVSCDTTFSHAHPCVWFKVGQVRRITSAHSLEAFHPHAVSLLGVPSFSSLSSTPPPTWTLSPATLTGIRPNPCATPLWDGQSGPLADPTPLTGYKPNFCIDVSRVSTRRSMSGPWNTASTLRVTWRTPSQPPWILTIFLKQLAASGIR